MGKAKLTREEAVNLLDELDVDILRFRRRSLVYQRGQGGEGRVDSETIRRTQQLLELPNTHRLFVIIASIGSRFAIVRFLGDGAFVAIASCEACREVRDIIEATPVSELAKFGGGLSGATHLLNLVEKSDAAETRPAECTAAAAAKFLNEAFDFIFRGEYVTNRHLRAKGMVRGIEYLNYERWTFSAPHADYVLSPRESQFLEVRFERMIRALGLQRIAALYSSPIAKRPWARGPLNSIRKPTNLNETGQEQERIDSPGA
jgi:hypothetical protein